MSLKKLFRSFVWVCGLGIAFSLTSFLEVSATAAESIDTTGKVGIDYSGKIDAATGEAVVGSAVSVSGDYYILKKNELAYNVKKDQYHILCGDRGGYCNVPSDAVLSHGEKLVFIPDEGIACEFFLDGEKLSDITQTIFQESGNYTITLYNHAEDKERSVNFVILDEVVNDFKGYRLPAGFEYTGVYLDGVRKSVSYNNYFDFLEEGFYRLQWENSKVGHMFITEFTLDMTAPTLRLPEVFNGVATGSVSFSDMEQGAYVRWIKDSRSQGRIEDASEVLSDTGNYIIRVYDQAGNYTEYTFAIEGYFDTNAVLAILFAIALLGGGFFYCRRLRTHMRVG